MDEPIRFISTLVVIVIFLSLSWYYRTAFRKDKLKSRDKGPIIGFFIVVFSLLLAFYLMQSGSS